MVCSSRRRTLHNPYVLERFFGSSERCHGRCHSSSQCRHRNRVSPRWSKSIRMVTRRLTDSHAGVTIPPLTGTPLAQDVRFALITRARTASWSGPLSSGERALWLWSIRVRGYWELVLLRSAEGVERWRSSDAVNTDVAGISLACLRLGRRRQSATSVGSTRGRGGSSPTDCRL